MAGGDSWWTGADKTGGASWAIRVFNNLFPRIPEKLTGGHNESYVVVEDPRHFLDHPRSVNDLTFTGALGEEHFFHLILTDVKLMRHVFANPSIHSMVSTRWRVLGQSSAGMRKSGASAMLPASSDAAAPCAIRFDRTDRTGRSVGAHDRACRWV